MKINNMLKKLYTLFLVAIVTLVAADDCAAQFGKMTIKDYGIKSIVPESFSSVRGAVWVEVVNPTETFTVSDISGKVYKEGSPMIQGTAPAFTVGKGESKVEISGAASLCPGASLWSVLGMFFFDPDDYSVDISMTITLASGTKRTVEKKNLPVTALLKLK